MSKQNYNSIILLIIVCILCISIKSDLFSQENDFLSIDLRNEIKKPNIYFAQKCFGGIEIDGKADEAIWMQANWSDSFVDIEGQDIPSYETRVKMLWDENYLYVYAILQEPHIWANLTERDAIIYHDNDFEVFIAPDGGIRHYGEIEINALGTVMDLMLDKPYRYGGKANLNWDLKGLQSQVHIEGTINDPADTDRYWSVEMAIPLKAFIDLKRENRKATISGQSWRMNFSRVNWEHEIRQNEYVRKRDTSGKLMPEHNWVWSPQGIINMHAPEMWGILHFTDGIISPEKEREAVVRAMLEQVAVLLCNHTRWGSLSEMKMLAPGTTKNVQILMSDDQSMDVTYTRTNLGFEYKLLFPDFGKTVLINESGMIKFEE